MKTWSIEEVLASLEAQAAFYREREAFHAGHEAHHREKRSAYAAELAEIDRRLEAFRASAVEAVDFAARQVVPAPSPDLKQMDLGSASRPKIGRMVSLLLQGKGGRERFGPVGLAREVNQRFGERLRKPATVAQVSIILRRMCRLGKIHLVRRGRPRWEALYVKEVSQAVVD
jgi:hypothetical protein